MSQAPSLPSASRDAVALSSLPPGARAIVHAIDATHGVGQRLADLGLLPGTEIRVVRRAPLGDPVVYELRGYRLCLRRTEAAQVRVHPLDAALPARA